MVISKKHSNNAPSATTQLQKCKKKFFSLLQALMFKNFVYICFFLGIKIIACEDIFATKKSRVVRCKFHNKISFLVCLKNKIFKTNTEILLFFVPKTPFIYPLYIRPALLKNMLNTINFWTTKLIVNLSLLYPIHWSSKFPKQRTEEKKNMRKKQNFSLLNKVLYI